MNLLVAGILLFFIPHSISIINEGWRNRLVAKMGELPWKGLYTLCSFAGLYLIIVGYADARLISETIYTPPAGLRHLALLLLALVFPLLLSVYLPGRIKAIARNPMLIGTLLWALAHLLLNGRLADVLLFGSFGVWALADLWSMRSREQRPIATGPVLAVNDIIVIVAGLAIYVGFLFKFHTWITGVPLLAS